MLVFNPLLTFLIITFAPQSSPVDTTVQTSHQTTFLGAMVWSVASARRSCLRHLLEHVGQDALTCGGEVVAVVACRCLPVHAAACVGDLEMMELLMDAGFKVRWHHTYGPL